MIDTLMLIDDENLFHLVFEDACSMLDIALSIESLDSSDEADRKFCLLYTSPSPRDGLLSRMPSSA